MNAFNIPLGDGIDGSEVSLDVAASPHTIYLGGTGAGTSTAVSSHIVNALTRGHQIAIIDPLKLALDFVPLRPWASVWADNLTDAADAMPRIVAELDRRQAARNAERFTPFTVVIDEATWLANHTLSSYAQPESDLAQKEVAAAAAITSAIRRIARDGGSVGVHLVIVAQRAEFAAFGTNLRASATAVQLVRARDWFSPEALSTVFSRDAAHKAAELLREHHDGRPGLGVTTDRSGEPVAFRFKHTDCDAIPALLEALNVPFATDLQSN